MTVKLNRTTFQTSRLLEFCSEKELVNQTGHQTHEWPLVILKGLLDNALDACEEAGVADRGAHTTLHWQMMTAWITRPTLSCWRP